MDIDNLQQNMNTRVVFKEPRGMIRWLQLFFAIIAFSTVADFYTTIGLDITCPSVPPSNTTQASTTGSPAPAANASAPSVPASTVVPNTVPTVGPLGQAQVIHPKLIVGYPFDFSQQYVVNNCTGFNLTYKHVPSLSGSPQFYVMTGVLSLIYAAVSLVAYLFFSSTYESVPVWPVADLIVAGILCLFWFIASISFSSGVSMLKSTVVFESIEQSLCPETTFKNLQGAQCLHADAPSWKSLDVGLVTGFTSFFLWGAGLWFVYKETHFHVPRDNFGR